MIKSSRPVQSRPVKPHCHHCQQPISRPQQWLAQGEKNQSIQFCCGGCLAVYEIIKKQGLKDFYKLNPTLPPPPFSSYSDSTQQGEFDYLLPDAQTTYVKINKKERNATFVVQGMHCAACSWLIERRLNQLPGVRRAHVNLELERLLLTWVETETLLIDIGIALKQLSYKITPYRADRFKAMREQESAVALKCLAISGLGMMQVMMFAFALYAGALHGMEAHHELFIRLVSALVAAVVLFFAGKPILVGAFFSLKNKNISMDLPIATALILTFAASIWGTFTKAGEVYFESVSMFVFFITLSRFLRMKIRHKNSEFLANLLTTKPLMAWRKQQNIFKQVQAETLAVNDLIRIKPGEIVPVDMFVTQGNGLVNQAMLTGEIKAKAITPGMQLKAGSQNLNQAIEGKVKRRVADSYITQLSSILNHTDLNLSTSNGSESGAPMMFAQRLAPWVSIGTLGLAFGVYIIWFALGSDNAFWISVSVLVATCPCALSIANPTAITATLSALTKAGVLVKSPNALFDLLRIKHWCLDKTGTLTQGHYELTQVSVLNPNYQDTALDLAAYIEQSSSHPIALAFVNHQPQSLWHISEVTHFSKGIRASANINLKNTSKLQKPVVCFIGSLAFLKANQCANDCADQDNCAGQDNKNNTRFLNKSLQEPTNAYHRTQVYLGIQDEGIIAKFTLMDPIRPGVDATLKQLKEHAGKITLITGDETYQAIELERQFFIKDIKTGQSPEQKAAFIKTNKKDDNPIAMIGDGINDCLALKQANVSISFANGAHISKNAADVLLLTNNLTTLTDLLQQCKRTRQIIQQNHRWALAYNFCILPIAAFGFITPYLAALGMSLSSLVVVLNASRLNRLKKVSQL